METKLKKNTQEELNEILRLHELWLENKPQGKRADLSYCNLRGVDLTYTNLTNANLTGTNLFGVDLTYTNLTNADLTGADLTYANLTNADLTNTKGLPTQEEMLDKLFEKTKEGYIVYKTFGMYYDPPEYWKIKEDSVIEEKVNMNRRKNCSYGINVSTVEWIKDCMRYDVQSIWKCLLYFEDLDKVCVPYGTDGKIRCGKLKLLEVI